jgi:D-3-phosphoglycerate dehydrogenase intervening domain
LRSTSNPRRRRDHQSLITLSVATQEHERSISGTVFHDGKLRNVAINEIEDDALVAPMMIDISNDLMSNLGVSKATETPPSSDGNTPEPFAGRWRASFLRKLWQMCIGRRKKAFQNRDGYCKKNFAVHAAWRPNALLGDT